MTQVLWDLERVYTLEEFLSLDLPETDAEGQPLEYELIEGKLVAKEKYGPSAEHGRVLFKLATELGIYLKAHPIGFGYNETPCTLGQTDPKASWVEPDLCLVLTDRLPTHFKGPLPVAPDLAVEVWSPSDSTEKVQTKIEAYQSAGVKLIWSIYMLSRFVVVYRAGSTRRTLLDLADQLDGYDLLPGFAMPVQQLFD